VFPKCRRLPLLLTTVMQADTERGTLALDGVDVPVGIDEARPCFPLASAGGARVAARADDGRANAFLIGKANGDHAFGNDEHHRRGEP
jgi:hypothetical protein